MSQLDQVGVDYSVSQVLLCFWHLFCSTQEQKLQSFFMTPNRVGTAIAGWKFLLLGELFQTHFLNLTWEIPLERLTNLPPKTSMETLSLCKSPGCKKNSLF